MLFVGLEIYFTGGVNPAFQSVLLCPSGLALPLLLGAENGYRFRPQTPGWY
jgi:hypothetical protein